ncbi:MAG: hypothetical protein RBS28_06990 [Rhodocyclaceae bacterium]|nr:hypothetical protein [Rhodocyclaceae bacterium]
MNAAALPMPDRAAGRRMFLLLVAALALPFVLAAALIFSGWRPAATPHHGELLAQAATAPPLSLDDLAIRAGPPKSALAGRWLLVAVAAGACDAACARRLDALRRVHVALYKAMPRVRRVLLADGAAGAPPDLTVAAGWPALAPGHVYLVDPRGRAVLRYDAAFNPGGMLKDIERLLRYSWSG